ncbi:MAG: lipopolysaccharide biosynthesis protein [Muribaculaceae bacterium]|nr:lipopolysaccharide biosynthesis protein [Muribaculaceae bacterium]
MGTDNRRIAKNTLMLYIRMFLLMLVSFYTSRVVLNALGVEDFGVYNVVGGIIGLMAFFNSSMGLATNRFLSFAIGKKDNELLTKTFIMCVETHMILAGIIILIGETVGLWYFYNFLNIPIESYEQAMVVYQLSVAACVISVLSIPFTSLVISHEDMGLYAYISIVEGVLKLTVAFLITIVSVYRLSYYAFFVFISSTLVIGIWIFYSRRKYRHVQFHFGWYKNVFKDIYKFIGWQFYGSASWVLRTQGVSLVLNYFFGPVLNAARTIGVQINGGITTLLTGFQTAVNPQIIKKYASGQLEELYNLIFRSSKLSFLLLFILAFPVLMGTEPILKFWLKIIPDYGVVFAQLMIIASLADALSGTLAYAALATGKIKLYTLIVNTISLSDIVFVYIAFKLGFPPQSLVIVEIFICLFICIARILILRKLIGISSLDYLSKVILPEFLVVTISFLLILPLFFFNVNIFIVIILSFIVSLGSSFFIGFNRTEQSWVLSLIKNKLKIA